MSTSPARTAEPLHTSHAVSRLRIRHLQLLDALQRLGSLRRAATELGLAQPAAVTLVDDLEHAFGVQLVVREHTGTTLTPAAHAVVARARLAIQEVFEAREEARHAHSAGGRLRIGASPYLISALLPGVVGRMHSEVPGTRIDIHEGTLGTLATDLIEGRLDAVLGSVDRATVLSTAVKLEAVFLGTEPMYVVAGSGHPLYGTKKATLEDVLAGPWALPHASSHIRELVDTAVFDLGHPPLAPMVECRGLLNLMGIAASAGLLTIAPKAEIARGDWPGRLAIVRSPLRFHPRPYAIVSRRYAQHLPQIAVLRRCVKDLVKTLIAPT
jgi:DNA-binding transcriptional LysR family regulator